ncbi:hypothetical protein [Nitrincola schmidtii]|uniref:hypothetical protein n=1 Tax=Nitrincola schmidtii TaxID=1730894 RepID=UPI00124DCF3D|nr:hypothetical protein [Nitrincola schmidtii]
MARIDDAADALQALAKHRDIIIDAYLNQGGALHDTEENRSAIKSLMKHQLTWQIDMDEPVRLSQSLTSLLAVVTRSQLRFSANSAVADLWKEIEGTIDGYREAKNRGALEDSNHYLENAFFFGHQLIESLRSSLSIYARHINTEFTHIHNLDLRAIENRKMIERASEFNTILETFDYQDLHNKAGDDSDLRRLLLKFIPSALEDCRKQLGYSIERLINMLHTINRQQEKARLVDCLIEKFDRDESYHPSVDDLNDLPSVLNRAVRLCNPIYPDLANPEHEDILASIVESLPTLTVTEKEKFVPQPVKNGLNEKAVEIPVNPMIIVVQEILELLSGTDEPISAKKVYHISKLDNHCELEIWYMALFNEINGLPLKQRASLDIHFVESPDDTFSGNFWVSDIVLRKVGRNE